MNKIALSLVLIFGVLGCLAQSPAQSESMGDDEAEKRNWPLAFAYYQDAFRKDSTLFERKFKLAFAAMKVYEDALAIRLFQEVNRSDQGKIHPEALYYLGQLYQRKGDYPMAEQMWKKMKKKMAKVDAAIVNKEQLDEDLSELSWAMSQPIDEHVEIQWYHWNSTKSEAHPQWLGDTIALQQWKNSAWHSMLKLPMSDSLVPQSHSNAQSDILQIKRFNDKAVGVNTNASGRLQLMEKDHLGWNPIAILNESNHHSSMPCFAQIDGVLVLFFASDRPGGMGGWDIWMSRWFNGWQAPFPLDKAVNTANDELSPFFDQGSLYFSSKGHNGFGELDVFKNTGKPGQWGVTLNVGRPINSSKNDMGLDVKRTADKEEWLIASARNNDGCCLDIGHWTVQLNHDSLPLPDSSEQLIQTIQQWLPLSLYFHNDEPNPRSTLSTTDWDYSDCFQSYLQQALNYQSNGVSVADWERFEDEQLNIPYQKWQRIMALMLNTLKRGDTLQIQLRGFASPLAASDYNEKLTSRRIQSVKNELSKFDQGALNPYMAHQLVIEELPMGEESSQVALSDDAQNKRESVFSEKARAARRIEIVGIRRIH